MPAQDGIVLNLVSRLDDFGAYATSVQLPRPINFGIVAFTRPSPNEAVVEATIQSLRRSFGEENVRVREYTMTELAQAIRDEEVDIFLSSAGFYWRLMQSGAVAVASLASKAYPDPNHGEGSAFVVRSDSTIQSFVDMKGKMAAASSAGGFTGYLIPMGEVVRRGFAFEKFFSSVAFVGPDDRLKAGFDLMREGKVDVAILRQCWLEHYLQKHPQERGMYRVIEPRDRTPAQLKNGVCQRSTELYPSWVLASAPAAPPEITKAVVYAAFSMAPTGDGHYWTVGTDYRAVDELYRSLRLGPYEWMRNWTFSRVWDEYGNLIIAFLVFLLAWIAHSVRVTRLVTVRTQELRDALEREKELKAQANETHERIERLQKSGIVGQLSSMIAHELRQPMSAALLFSKSARKILSRENPDKTLLVNVLGNIEAQIERANSIIDNVRAYAKGLHKTRQKVDLKVIIDQSITAFRSTGRYPKVDIFVETDPGVVFDANPLEWELVTHNLVKNACEACQNTERPIVRVGLEHLAIDKVRMTVTDNGETIGEEDFARLSQPLMSVKDEGLGLGLQIVRGIVESHGARLHFVRNRTRGLTAVIDINLRGAVRYNRRRRRNGLGQRTMELDYIKQKALIRILDDDEALGAALKLYLELDGWQVAAYTSARRFFAEDRPSVPGCLVLDVRMPELTGLECQRLLNERQSNIPIVFISGHGDIDMAVRTILDGAYDFLQKPVDEERLVRSVMRAAGDSVMKAEGKVSDEAAVALVESLTDREREVAKLVAQGLVSRTIGERLGISPRTAELHRSHAMKKLSAANPEQLRNILKSAGVL